MICQSGRGKENRAAEDGKHGLSNNTLSSIYGELLRQKANNIISDPSHPLHGEFELSLSGRWYRQSMADRNISRKSFVPITVKIVNGVEALWDLRAWVFALQGFLNVYCIISILKKCWGVRLIVLYIVIIICVLLGQESKGRTPDLYLVIWCLTFCSSAVWSANTLKSGWSAEMYK